MKKITITLLIALAGGIMAIAGYKLFERKTSNLSFEEQQKIHFANNPVNIASSAGNPDFTQAAAAVAPAVVHIITTYDGSGSNQQQVNPFDMFEEFFGRPSTPQRRRSAKASGSGVIISTDGYIVTNNHVVEDADKIEVELTDKRHLEAKLIGRDPDTDLALIKISAKDLPIVKFGDSDKVNIGEWVLAVGYPLGLQSTVTAGIVSATGRPLGLLGQEERQNSLRMNPNEVPLNTAIESFIQTDAVINRGNSGGALVNASGELVGINSAIASPSGYYAGYGFAIPVNLVKKVSNDFIEFGKVKRGYVGITFSELNAQVAKELGVDHFKGLYVQDVVEGGGAQKAGIKQGDIVTKINGREIISSAVLQEAIGRLHPGDKVQLSILRDGKERNISVTLHGEEVNEKASEQESSKSATQIYNDLGAGFIPLSKEKREQMGLRSGVVLTEIRQGGLFDLYDVPRGLIITSINGQAVNNIDEIESALAKGRNNMIQIAGVSSDGASVRLSFPIK